VGDSVIGNSVSVERYVDFNVSVGAVVGNAAINICSYCKMMKRKKIKTISLLIRNDLTTYWVIITLRKLYMVLQIQNINEN